MMIDTILNTTVNYFGALQRGKATFEFSFPQIEILNESLGTKG